VVSELVVGSGGQDHKSENKKLLLYVCTFQTICIQK